MSEGHPDLFDGAAAVLLLLVGNNTEKNMEAACDQMIRNTRRWLEEVEKHACEVTQQQRARLETSERVLRHIDTHNETYESVCITFLDNILLISGTALISKATDSISQEKSQFLEILKPKHEEIKGYLRKLEGKIGEIDFVINEIDEELKRRNYKLTEEEKLKVEMLLMDVDTKSQQAKIYFEAAARTLKSLHSDMKSYLSASGWDVFGWGVGGTALGAVVVGMFCPMLAPVMVGAGGGGVLTSVGRFLYGRELKPGEYEKLMGGCNELQSQLDTLKEELKVKRLDIDKLKRQFEKLKN